MVLGFRVSGSVGFSDRLGSTVPGPSTLGYMPDPLKPSKPVLKAYL